VSRKKKERLERELEKDREEYEDKRAVVSAAMAWLYNIALEDARRLFDKALPQVSPAVSLQLDLEPLITGASQDFLKRARKFLSTLADYADWNYGLSCLGTAQKVARINPSDEKVLEAVMLAGDVKIPQKHNFYEVPYVYPLTRIKLYCDESMGDYHKKVSNLEELVGIATSIFEAAGPVATNLYLEDLIEATRERNILIREVYKTDTEVTIGLFSEAQRLDPIVLMMQDLEESYKVLTRQSWIEIYKLLDRRRESPPIGYVAEKLAMIDEPGTALRLLKAEAPENRDCLLDELARNPGILKLAKTTGAGSRAVIGGMPWFRMPFGNGTFEEFLLGLEKPYQWKGAGVLLENIEILFSADSHDRIIDVTERYSMAELVLKDYFTMVRSGYVNKAALLLDTALQQPNQTRLKTIRSALNKIDGDIEPGFKAGNLETLERRISKARAVASQQRQSRFDAYISSLGIEDARSVSQGFSCLPDGMQGRFWTIADKGLQQALLMSNDLQENQSSMIKILLSDVCLWAAYQSLLESGQRLGRLELQGNIYAGLCARLLPESQARNPDLASAQTLTDSLHLERFSNIHIYGGDYSSETAHIIEKTIPVPTTVYHRQNPRRDAQQAGQMDLIIFITPNIDHDCYGPVKSECDKRGIKYLHFTRRGSSSIIDFLRTNYSAC